MICRRAVSFLPLIFSLLLTAGINGCDKKAQETKSAGLEVVCTFLPIYGMVQNIVEGVPDIRVSVLVSPMIGCPHDYSLTPAEAHRLEQADVLIMNGLGMERFLEGIPAAKRSKLKTIDASAGLTLILDENDGEGDEAADPRPGSSHNRAPHSKNPHAWVSPFRAAEMTRYIAAQLAEISPDAADRLLENARKYASSLDSLGDEFALLVSTARNKKVVTFHRAFDYFAKDVGLEIVGVIEIEAGVEPSAKNLAELAKRIQREKPAAIFSEPQYSDKLALMLAAETGVPVYPLDPVASGEADPGFYLRAMSLNLKVLRQAFAVTALK